MEEESTRSRRVLRHGEEVPSASWKVQLTTPTSAVRHVHRNADRQLDVGDVVASAAVRRLTRVDHVREHDDVRVPFGLVLVVEKTVSRGVVVLVSMAKEQRVVGCCARRVVRSESLFVNDELSGRVDDWHIVQRHDRLIGQPRSGSVCNEEEGCAHDLCWKSHGRSGRCVCEATRQ